MTIRSFLEELTAMDHTDSARYPDGSGGTDKYTVIVDVDGHGKLLNAKVRNVAIGRGIMIIRANGEKSRR